MPSDDRERATGPQVLRFLNDHRLDHSPSNYAFAHRLLFEADTTLKDEVGRITDGGVRITPDEVAKLSAQAPDNVSMEQDAAPQLDHLTLRVLDIIGDAASATGGLNRDLIGAAASMLEPGAPSVRAVVTAMIERTARAEARLAEATRQAQLLRAELNTVRSATNRDHLTGLPNRAAMEERLALAVTSAKGCAIAFVDVDRFKSINDAHGHGIGDRVLKFVASTLEEACHPHAVARWGGEEFLVLMEDTTAADAGAIVDAARVGLAERRLKLRENDAILGAISFSAGVVSSRGRTMPELVESAEALLHQAKHAGRNRVEIEPALVQIRSTRKETER